MNVLCNKYIKYNEYNEYNMNNISIVTFNFQGTFLFQSSECLNDIEAYSKLKVSLTDIFMITHD